MDEQWDQKRETTVHPTAIVERGAQLGVGVSIGPYCVVGSHVELGDSVRLASHVVVQGRTRIGARCRIWPFAVLGTAPQDLKYKGEDTSLVCGPDNQIREYCNFSLGTVTGCGETLIGAGNLFMVNTHIAHDCRVGSHCIFANGVSLAGHVEVGDRAVLGGHSAVHQFVKIGSLAMLAGGAIVVQDVPPFCTVHGNHAAPAGINSVGLRRAGVDAARRQEIKTMYKLLYQAQLSLETALNTIRTELPASEERACFLNFLATSDRGICR